MENSSQCYICDKKAIKWLVVNKETLKEDGKEWVFQVGAFDEDFLSGVTETFVIELCYECNREKEEQLMKKEVNNAKFSTASK